MLAIHMRGRRSSAPSRSYFLSLALVIALVFGWGAVSAEAASDAELRQLEQQLIRLPAEPYDREAAAEMAERIMAIDYWMLESLREQEVYVYLINGNITSHPAYSYLAGEVPRGWEDTGLSWDDVPGVGGSPVVVRIGYSAFGMGHGSVNLELHEIAHAIDAFVLDDISAGKAWSDVHRKERTSLFGNDPYYVYPEEYFAEAFAMYYLDGESRSKLRRLAPSSAALLDAVAAGKDAGGVVAAAGDIRVLLFGEPLTLDQPPLLLGGRTMVPLRAIFEALDASVEWDGTAGRVTAQKGATSVQLTIGSATAYIDGKPLTLDQPGTVVNGRTLVPLRFVGEAFGMDVGWDEEQRTVSIDE